MRFSSGSQVGPYEIVAPLGKGETGEVYRAVDRRIGRAVAIRVLRRPPDRRLASRFERDARALASFNHTNTVAIHEFDLDGETAFVASELVEGETLRARMASGIPWKKALEIGAAIGDGLAMAHARGIVHRDLKPENVFLASDGSVKILDFGIGHMKKTELPDAQADDAGAETPPGTIGYAAPEQLRGEEPAPASDLFSVGVILYEMIAGANPFARGTAAATRAAILDEEPPSLRPPMSRLPPELDLLVRRCLEKESDERCDSARNLAAELREIARDAEHPQEALARRRRRLSAAAAVALIALTTSLLLGRSRVAHLLGVAADPPASLAVLPFVNEAGDDLDYLSDGLTDVLINRLAEVRDLRVISPVTAFAFKGSQRDPVEIGRDLAVRAIITGRVGVKGNRLLVRVGAVDAITRAQLSAHSFERPRDRIATLAGDVVRTIAKDLRLELTRAERDHVAQAVTGSDRAFDFYLRGLKELSGNAHQASEKAILYFEKAVQADPQFARAHAILGETYLRRSVNTDSDLMRAKARQAISRALEIDPSIAEGYQGLGLLRYWDEWNLDAAQAEFQRALELNPNLAATYTYRASLLLYRGWFDAAIEQVRRGQELDPLSRANSIILADAFLYSDRIEEAHEELARLIGAAPEYPAGHYLMGRVHEGRGEGAAACREFVLSRQLAGSDSGEVTRLRTACETGGLDAYRRELLSVLRESEIAVAAVEIAETYAALGEMENAYRYLEIAYDEHANGILAVGIDPVFEPLRSDPRVTSLLRRAGLLGKIALNPPRPLQAGAVSGGGAEPVIAARRSSGN